MCFKLNVCFCIYSLCHFFPDLKTALVERSDFSSGTSSRSTKLLHGGVRYLQKAIMQLDYEQVPLHPPTLHFQTVLLLFPVFIFLCVNST